MKRHMIIMLVVAVAFTLLRCSSASDTSPTSTTPPDFVLTTTVAVAYGFIWVTPVYDGQYVVVSSEINGTLVVGRYDIFLTQIDNVITVADTSDTAAGDTIADHKHIFLNGFHYITFSTSGANYLYLLKLDTNFNRIGITTVVNNDAPTNDMFLVTDGTDLYVGKFLPGTGHRVYKYDQQLRHLDTFTIGGGSNRHANGAAAVYANGQFHLVAPGSLAPGQNDNFYRIIFDTNWNVVQERITILNDPGMLGIVSALSIEPSTQQFIIHYGRGNTDRGGPLYRAIYDANWNVLSNTEAISGDWTRPHSLIVNNTLYVGYDGAGVYLSRFEMSN